MTEDLKIGVSGTAVYKAVRNYLNNSPELKQKIDEQIQKLVEKGVLEEIARRKMAEQLTSYYTKDLLQKVAKDVFTAEIKVQLEALVGAAMKKYLEGAVLVVPKL
jgi:elongation factor P hydroxylase